MHNGSVFFKVSAYSREHHKSFKDPLSVEKRFKEKLDRHQCS